MPKEKNKALNPYYLELLKYLAVYKLKNRLGIDLSTEERNELAVELNEYNTKDSLNRIFSQGGKRRQNFNKSNLQGLCNYIGYYDWEEFIDKEYREWANELEEKLYADLSPDVHKKINKAVFLRILQEVEDKITKGITDYFETYIKRENPDLEDDLFADKLQLTTRAFNLCIDYLSDKNNEAHLILIYKIAENIDEGRHFLEGLNLLNVFKEELFGKIARQNASSAIDELIKKVENPLNREIMRLYANGTEDKDIVVYLYYQGFKLGVEEVKNIRWQTADSVFNQLKKRENGAKLLFD